MITLREKIKIDEIGMEEYYDALPPTGKIALLRDFESQEDYSDYNPGLRVYDTVNSLLWGQLVILEQTKVSKSSDIINKLSVILRPLTEEVFDNTDAEREATLASTILDLPYGFIVYILNKFEESREKVLFHQFNGVIYHKDDLKPKEDGDESGIVEEAEAQFNKTWYWYKLTKMLANDSFLDIDKVYRQKAMDAMVELAYITQENKLEKARNDRNQIL